MPACTQRAINCALAEPVDLAQPHAARAQRLARTDHDAACCRVEAQHVERMAGGDAEAASLPDGEVDDAVVAAEHTTVEIDDVAGLGGARSQPLDHVGVAAGRHETNVLAVVLVGDREGEATRELARLGLAALAQGETQHLKLLARGGEQEIALVALGIARAVEPTSAVRQRPRRDIVTGRQHLGAELARGGEQITEFDRLVALDARHRRLARDIARGEAVDHQFLEAAFVIEHVMGNADALGDRPCVMDVLTGAAGAPAVGGRAVVVELQRHPDDIVALGLEQRRSDRRIDAARHGDDHAGRVRPPLDIECIAHRGRGAAALLDFR